MIPSNMFILRGKLIGPPSIQTVGSSGLNIATFVLQYDEEQQRKSGPVIVEHFIQCESSQYDINIQGLSEIPVGADVFVTGQLEGRKNENNGNVRYFNKLKVKHFSAVSASDNIPF